MPTAVIFGAAGDLGRAISHTLKTKGFRVLGVARDENTLDGLEGTSADLARDSDVAAACLWVAQQAGTVDALVIASGEMFGATIADTSTDELHRVMANNFFAVQAVLRHASPLLSPSGHRLILGAFADKLTFPKLGAYAAAKAALDAWVRVLIREERQVKTTLLRLPAVDTRLWKKAPFPLPKGALTPQVVADSVARVLGEATTGVVDLPLA